MISVKTEIFRSYKFLSPLKPRLGAQKTEWLSYRNLINYLKYKNLKTKSTRKNLVLISEKTWASSTNYSQIVRMYMSETRKANVKR